MSKKPPENRFITEIARILNSGQSRCVAVTGNVMDLFHSPPGESSSENGEYLPLFELLLNCWSKAPNLAVVVCEFNKEVSFVNPGDADLMREAWQKFRVGASANYLKIKRLAGFDLTDGEKQVLAGDFERRLKETATSPSMALELLRQLCIVSRAKIESKPVFGKELLIIIPQAHMFIPEKDFASLSEGDRTRVGVLMDWFSDPEFFESTDSAVMITESIGSINSQIARLPQLLEVEVPSPDSDCRSAYISWFFEQQEKLGKESPQLWGTQDELAFQTAGLSIWALRQLLRGCVHTKKTLTPAQVVAKVEQFIQSQLGPDVVEFKRPKHTLKDVIGNENLKSFLVRKFIPRLKKRGKGAISGAAVAGPNRAGKSFIFEAVAAELGIVVLVLKNIRSMWYGQTDVIFGRLKRILIALDRVLIFMDEADTQMGGVGKDAHETERRLTGNIQNMMSDPLFRGRIFWLLITARIQNLSVDLRQPGRAGDMIIPVLDPDVVAHGVFVKWVLGDFLDEKPSDGLVKKVLELTSGYSAGAFDFVRRELAAESEAEDGTARKLGEEEILDIIGDLIQPDFERERRLQSLHAILNCTRKCLLPPFPNGCNSVQQAREAWRKEAITLEHEIVVAA